MAIAEVEGEFHGRDLSMASQIFSVHSSSLARMKKAADSMNSPSEMVVAIQILLLMVGLGGRRLRRRSGRSRLWRSIGPR